MKLTRHFFAAAVILSVALIGTVNAGAIRSGFNASTLAPNDDGSTGLEAIGFTVDFFGTDYSSLYVNNNGNVTFDSTLTTFTPFDLQSTNRVIIAPFFADVDTRAAGSPVTYGAGTVDGRTAFGVNWVDVDYFASSASHTSRNSFQLVMIERFDTGVGNFDFEFNYDQIEWETGQASGSDLNGLGGNSARVGYSNGTDTAFELVGSAINGAFLDTGPAATALISNSLNSNEPGRYLFSVRNGTVVDPDPRVPVPSALLLVGIGLLAARLLHGRRG